MAASKVGTGKVQVGLENLVAGNEEVIKNISRHVIRTSEAARRVSYWLNLEQFKYKNK